MLTELAYVKAELERLGHAGWLAVSEGADVPMRTIKRIGYGEVEYPRSDTVGKLATYLRTHAKRRNGHKRAA